MQYFLVYRTSIPYGTTEAVREYVESIDIATGETEWTTNRNQARIFIGNAWEEVWVNYSLEYLESN